jgi:hypothetical protein
MTERKTNMPEHVVAMQSCGFATWATDDVDPVLRVRVWGLQVDDERELPGHERTQIPDDEIWEINLEAKDGSHYEVDSRKLKAAG